VLQHGAGKTAIFGVKTKNVIHHIIGLLSLILISQQCVAQDNLQLQRLNDSCDTLVLQTSVSFSWGYGTTCPQLEYYETSGNSDTMELKLYYNVSGFWPQVGCGQIDTITTLILPNVVFLKGIAFALSEIDTTATSSAQIELCSTSGIETLNSDELFAIAPNPFTSELRINCKSNEQFVLSIYTSFGHKVMCREISTSDLIYTEGLAKGLYFYQLSDEKGILSSGKIVKE
jgi:hypothetical protein